MSDAYYAQSVPETHRPYVAAEDRYQHLEYRRVGDSGLLLPPLSLGLWYNFGDNKPFDTQREVLRHAFDRGHHALRPGQQLRPSVRLGRGELRPDDAHRLRAVPRRDDHLHQGRLGHVARPVRQRRLAQVRPVQPRRVAGADEPRPRRHLLLAPLRPGHPGRRDDRRARHRRSHGQGDVRRHLVLLAGANGRGGRHRPGPGHAAGHPPARLLDAQPLGRARPAHRAGGARHGLDRVHGARPGPAVRPLPRRRARRPHLRPPDLRPAPRQRRQP